MPLRVPITFSILSIYLASVCPRYSVGNIHVCDAEGRCMYAHGDRRRMRRETSEDSIQRSAGEDIGLAARIPSGGVPLLVRGAPGCALSCRRSSSHVSESTASIPRISSPGSASVRTTDGLVRSSRSGFASSSSPLEYRSNVSSHSISSVSCSVAASCLF